MDRKLLQYLVEYLLKRARRMGALCRPRRLMWPMTTWQASRPMSCGSPFGHS